MQVGKADPPAVEQGRVHWLVWLALASVFLLIVPWLQRTFWLTQCPGQVGDDCERQLDDLYRTFAIEIGLCIGFVLICAATARVGEVERITKRIAFYIEKWTNRGTLIALAAAV